ncbi:histidine kinase [Marispirochaeta aestuarii]|uniref:sensor histidine kinase n=1 Tax=Marispirochaeta aestuarii TaxID=1963862 RepID=UPI0029C83BA4|nr:histidine kinase [Marispirochaeta aestuarii]
MEPEESFSDLGATRFMTFAEFASLTLDNHVKYRALIENQEARFQALQSQVKPHFLYNILSGIIGLNRQGGFGKSRKDGAGPEGDAALHSILIPLGIPGSGVRLH